MDQMKVPPSERWKPHQHGAGRTFTFLTDATVKIRRILTAVYTAQWRVSVAAIIAAPASARWSRARRTAPAPPGWSARQTVPGAAIVEGSQLGPVEARQKVSARACGARQETRSSLHQPGVTRPPISGKRS
jgi:hypothetical protein